MRIKGPGTVSASTVPSRALSVLGFVILECVSGASAFGDPTQRLVEDTENTEPSAGLTLDPRTGSRCSPVRG